MKIKYGDHLDKMLEDTIVKDSNTYKTQNGNYYGKTIDDLATVYKLNWVFVKLIGDNPVLEVK